MKKITYENCKSLPDGTILRLIQTGDGWEDDTFKTCEVVKIQNRLYEISSSFWDADNINDKDGYEIEVFYYLKDNMFKYKI